MKRILFVDDEPNFLNGIRRMLRSERDTWDLHFAQSAQEGLDMAVETSFDVIVSDVQMPNMSGLDLVEALRADDRTKNTPVVILTGNAELDLKRRALDLGATDLLNKPVNPEDLRARLRNTIQLKEFQDQILQQNVILDRKVRERTRDLEASRLDIVMRLAKAGEFRDEETGDHVMRVAWCSWHLARKLGLSETDSEQIFMASPLHDIGKIGIPDDILRKTARLDTDERRNMEQHCMIGAAILQEQPKGLPPRFYALDDQNPVRDTENKLLSLAAEIALNHHEKWDGTGYPVGKRGDEIPLAAQIVALADVYDALRSVRSYKPSFPVEKTVAMIESQRNSHFSADLVALFLESVEDFEDIRRRYSD